MKCPQCQQPLRLNRKTVTRAVDGRTVEVSEVPVLQCDACGKVVLSARVLRRMNSLIRSTGAPVLTYAEEDGWKALLEQMEGVLRTESPQHPLTRRELVELVPLTLAR